MSPARNRLDRRTLLRGALIGVGAAGFNAALPASALAQGAVPGDGPYGLIEGREPDDNGIILPEGFSSRIVAQSGDQVADSGYVWPIFPDGAATFPDGEGGWYLSCNSEVHIDEAGAVSAIHFGPDGEIIDAYSTLVFSRSNCAGGPTPWGKWLSCEEYASGAVWETDPAGVDLPRRHPAMGLFAHEAAAVDPERRQIYLTEDQPDGLLYRYTPDSYPSLDLGLLEAAEISESGDVTWWEVPDPQGSSEETRYQVDAATPFAGGEGIWWHDGAVYFSTKHDDRVQEIDTRQDHYRVIYDAAGFDDPVLNGVDNVTVDAGSGDVYVAEDSTSPLELVLLSPEGEVARFARLTGSQHDGSEITGPCFNPDRTRLYFSSQRGGRRRADEVIDIDSDAGAGITYEITGPFRGRGTTAAEPPPTSEAEADAETTSVAVPEPSPTTTIEAATGATQQAASSGDSDGNDGNDGAIALTVAGSAVLGGAAGVMFVRRRRNASDPDPYA